MVKILGSSSTARVNLVLKEVLNNAITGAIVGVSMGVVLFVWWQFSGDGAVVDVISGAVAGVVLGGFLGAVNGAVVGILKSRGVARAIEEAVVSALFGILVSQQFLVKVFTVGAIESLVQHALMGIIFGITNTIIQTILAHGRGRFLYNYFPPLSHPRG